LMSGNHSTIGVAAQVVKANGPIDGPAQWKAYSVWLGAGGGTGA